MPVSPQTDGAVAPLCVELELDAGLVPVQGRVRAPLGIDRRFSGWLELMAVIERLNEHARGVTAPGGDRETDDRKEPAG